MLLKHAFTGGVLGMISDMYIFPAIQRVCKMSCGFRRVSSCQPPIAEYPAVLGSDREAAPGKRTDQAMPEYNSTTRKRGAAIGSELIEGSL